MYEWIKQHMLRLLKVPPEPTDPMGDVEQLVVFRASPSYFKYRLVVWAISVVVSIVGAIVFFLFEVFGMGLIFDQAHLAVDALFIGVTLLIVLGLIFRTIWSYVMLRLDYELRWYKVTDRSLRIREGVMTVREMTMTFDNIQNISVTQGPLQRLLNIADLRVETAGGGGAAASSEGNNHGGLNMHVGYFRGIDNADDVLALMQRRLRAARGSGLGDIDDEVHSPAEARGDAEVEVDADVIAADATAPTAVAAARQLLDEVRQMRLAAERR